MIAAASVMLGVLGLLTFWSDGGSTVRACGRPQPRPAPGRRSPRGRSRQLGGRGGERAGEDHDVWLSGPDTGNIPFRPESVAARILMPIIGRIIFHRVLTTSTPIGRKPRPKMVSTGEPLLRVKPKDLAEAGVARVPRVTGIEHGESQLEDGRRLDVANVVWCTGFHPGFTWIDLPALDPHRPEHHRGVGGSEPGLYFLGLKFLYAVSSEQIHGVGRDAAHIADTIAAQRGSHPGASWSRRASLSNH